MSTKKSKGIFSKDHKKKISDANKGKHYSIHTEFKKGHKLSKETLLKISDANKGRVPWNKGTKGVMKAWNKGKTLSKSYRKKLSIAHIGNNPCQAKKPSYYSAHGWISRHKDRPKCCEHCGQEKTYTLHWANIDHKYKLNINDYIALCASCHRKYDIKKGLRK